MYSVSPQLYDEALSRLNEQIGSMNYFSGVVDFCFGDIACRLRCSTLVYRQTLSTEEGTHSVICDLVPVWWEFHTTIGNEKILNDFSFDTLRSLLERL